jgi:hypothetical protein
MIDDALLDRLGDAYQKVRDLYWIPYNNYTKWADTTRMIYGEAKPKPTLPDRRSSPLLQAAGLTDAQLMAQDFMEPNTHWTHPTFEQFVQATLRNRGVWVE